MQQFLSDVESDPVGEYGRCGAVLAGLGLAGLGLPGVTEADCSALRYICECVSRRAAFMCAAGLSALLKEASH